MPPPRKSLDNVVLATLIESPNPLIGNDVVSLSVLLDYLRGEDHPLLTNQQLGKILRKEGFRPLHIHDDKISLWARWGILKEDAPAIIDKRATARLRQPLSPEEAAAKLEKPLTMEDF